MKLVNKMELLKQLADKLNNSQWYSETEEGFEAAMSMLEDAPTVEAIPIEWIRHYKSIYGLTYSTLYTLLETMIDDWEKENKTETN